MNVDEIAQKCDSFRASGEGKYMARCPAHEDNSASLSIGTGEGGRVLLKCFAGCDTQAIVGALGIQMSDLMPPAEFKPKSEIVAAYDYRDEDGELLYQAVRMVPKDFRQRKPKPGGGWEHKVGDVRKVLYRLPELIAAKPTEIVFICEGEKDCDNLKKLGMLATTNVGGAGKWKPEYTAILKGRRVCILPDNDVPGAEHANKVAAELKGTAAKVKVLLLPGLPNKGDVSDWLSAGGSAEELLQLASTAEEWTKPIELQPKAREPPAVEPKPNAIKVVTLEDAMVGYLDTVKAGKKTLIELGLPDLDEALGGGVEEGEMVVLAGLPSHGKSAVALQIAHTWTLAGMPCFMVSEEMSPMVLGKRALQFISEVPIDQWRSDMELVQTDMKDYASRRAKCFIAEPCGDSRIAIEQIDRAVAEHGVKCAIVDYTQHMKAAGNSKYEQVSNTSIAIKNCAARNKIVVLALAQLNREIEKRPQFVPRLSDISDSGQIGKDADVIIFQCWPCRLNDEIPPVEYQFFIGKNRNREIKKFAIQCEFHPHRQMVLPQSVKRKKNYEAAFDKY